MIQNYIKTAFRHIARNKLFSTINILGLSIGMACSILIFLWVHDELSYDKFHKNADNIYRVIMEKEEKGVKDQIARTAPPVGRVLKEDYPEIVASTRFFFLDLGFMQNMNIYNEDGAFVDKDVFRMFDIHMIKGDTASVLALNTNIIISEKIALKLFGSTDVVGKDLRIGTKTVFTISGVFEDIPVNSHLKFEFLCNYDLLFEFGLRRELWNNYNNSHYTYVMLDEESDFRNVNSKIKDLILKNSKELKATIFLQPIKDVYLKSNFSGDIEGLGNIKNIYIFTIISFLIILIAGFNFMNLTTAQASSRLKEIGMRKVLGGQRKSLVFQFLGEAIFMTFLAHIVAIILVELFAPVFNMLTNKQLSVQYFSLEFLVLILGIILLVGLFSGSYPAAYLSRLNPIKIFKGGVTNKSGRIILRKVLVISQFAISIVLIISAIIIIKQMVYLSKKDLGFNKDNIIYINLTENRDKYETLKENLLNHPEISGVTVLSNELVDVIHMAPVSWEGKNSEGEELMNIMYTDHDFVSTMQMEIIRGEDFRKAIKGDSITAFIVNEAAARQMGFNNPIGKRFSTTRSKGYITGLVKNFNYQPLYNDIKPMVLTNYSGEPFYLYIRFKSKDIKSIILLIQSEFKDFSPNDPFEYYFLDESINKMYKNENNLAKLTGYFTLITIFISCLGLFGLVSFMAEQRIKEIGIRKAIGASIAQIVFILSKEIIIWVIIANLISWPIAYFAANKWLVNFSYRIELDIWIFITSGLIALIIAFLTISLRALKTAHINPVNALRYE
ncbi:MAG: ABC transporter permease [Bacteroidales bacterium]|nr:ABC transporter permease [Bacteroidales bacterium]